MQLFPGLAISQKINILEELAKPIRYGKTEWGSLSHFKSRLEEASGPLKQKRPVQDAEKQCCARDPTELATKESEESSASRVRNLRAALVAPPAKRRIEPGPEDAKDPNRPLDTLGGVQEECDY